MHPNLYPVTPNTCHMCVNTPTRPQCLESYVPEESVSFSIDASQSIVTFIDDEQEHDDKELEDSMVFLVNKYSTLLTESAKSSEAVNKLSEASSVKRPQGRRAEADAVDDDDDFV